MAKKRTNDLWLRYLRFRWFWWTFMCDCSVFFSLNLQDKIQVSKFKMYSIQISTKYFDLVLATFYDKANIRKASNLSGSSNVDVASIFVQKVYHIHDTYVWIARLAHRHHTFQWVWHVFLPYRCPILKIAYFFCPA